MNRSYALFIMVAACLFCLAACGQKYEHSDATKSIAPDTLTTQKNWATTVEDSGEVKDGWIADFNDPLLNDLVREAMKNNPDLQAAAARVDRAWALAAQAGAALKPTVGLGAQLSGVTDKAARPTQGVGTGLSWELDVWGKLRLGAQAAEESAKSMEANYEFARQSLAASTATAWFMACETDIQLRYLKTVVDLLEQMSAIVETKQEVGQVSMLDVHQIKAQLASAKEAVTKTEIAKKQAARSLETIVGRYPSAEIKAATTLDALPGPIPTGMPSSILERRPDIIAAEDVVASAFYAEKGAELLHLPSFTINAGAGLTTLGDAIAGLTGGAFAPLYTGGAIEAQIAQATAEQKEAIAQYGSAALQAFKEVENALTNEELLAARKTYLTEAASENKEAFKLSRIQYAVGKTDLFKTLSLQSKWVGAEIALLDVQREQLDNRVGLHLALGGSFEEVPASTE